MTDWRGWLQAVAGLLYPPVCVGCGTPLEPGQYLCAGCAGKTRGIAPPRCQVCSQEFEGEFPEGAFTCSPCLERRFSFDCAVCARRYDELVRNLVSRFKYQDEHYLRRLLGGWLAEALHADERFRAGPPVTALVPVPLHPRRFRERGFNQAAALCRVVSRHGGLPVWSALRRVRYTEAQARLDRSERLENLRGAFVTARRRPVAGAHLVLVDDVFTTGSTVNECARVLRKAGAASVRVLAVARR